MAVSSLDVTGLTPKAGIENDQTQKVKDESPLIMSPCIRATRVPLKARIFAPTYCLAPNFESALPEGELWAFCQNSELEARCNGVSKRV